MIPSYKKYAKQSQLENRHNGHKQCINKRLQQTGHLVPWEKTKPNKAKFTLSTNKDGAVIYPAPTLRLFRKHSAGACPERAPRVERAL
jgi:hypothetical protein